VRLHHAAFIFGITAILSGLPQVAKAGQGKVSVQSRAAPAVASAPEQGIMASPYCSGEYADELAALSQRARDFDQQQPPYTYCVRTSAVYECPTYAPDGTLHRTRRKVVAHGTAFGFRRRGVDTLLVTNEHVAEWPAVTDDDHQVPDVPGGCRRVSDSLKIVENERDAYERDDVPLARVIADPQLDIAVLRAKVPLPIMPWKIGKSSLLRERNVVAVRGFPLGVLRANNVGKVVSAYDRDQDRDWDHDDFVVDALLSPGNSGSPVFAISCRTGEFELVGVYHAGYTAGSALNLVVGVDQLRDLFATLKRSTRLQGDGRSASVVDRDDRAKLVAWARMELEPFFPLGSLTAAVRARPDGALIFELMGKDFPLQGRPILVLEDLPAAGNEFGRLGRVWAGNRQGLREAERLDAEAQAQIAKLLDDLRHNARLVASHRAAARLGMGTRERFQALVRMERNLKRATTAQEDVAQGAIDLADHLCPGTADATMGLAVALESSTGPGTVAAASGTSPTAPSAWEWRPALTWLPPIPFVVGPEGTEGFVAP